jgi:chemosensory pili system protein ChpA (sensor histidine kinase/response regulator)
MSMEFDIGPLSWVKGEIDLALERAGAALSAPAGKELAAACNHLHQAHGALAIVGLDGITEFSNALEKLFQALAAAQVPDTEDAIRAAQAGIAALRGYLDGLMGGEPNQPLKLYPAYAGLLAARGEAVPGAVALFFPDLTQRPPRREVEPPPLDAEKLATRLKMARMGFERGLLKWLKGDAKGIGEMKNSVAMIESTQVQPADRAFWWIALGFYTALAADALPDADAAKKLALKIGAQIKKLTEGHAAVAERLLAEALFQVASARDGDEPIAIIDMVRAAYRLADLMPRTSTADAEALRPQIRRLRELISGAKDDWNKLCAGSAAALPPFHEKVTQMAERGSALDQPDLTRLLGATSALADALRRDPSRHTDAMALEVATALLLADNALENFDAILDTESGKADFAHQIDAVCQRLEAVASGNALGELDLPHLDAMSRRAQERLLLASVAREITSNLAQIEQALDSYFRDPGKAEGRTALGKLARPLKQVEGALAVLGQDRACAVLCECEAQINELSAQGGTDKLLFEELASKLSALGFFVEQLELGAQPDIDAILNPQRVRPEAAPETPVAPPVAVSAVSPAPTFAAPAVATTEADEFGTASADIPLPEPEPLAAPVPAREPPPPSAASARLAEASAEEIDAELLGIFLEEAHEVLATIADHLPRVHAAPDDIATLTTLRRSFHTLKGSGRMVGLSDLGESAYGVEQVLNKWLQAAQAASPALLAMLDSAATLFSAWTAALASGSHDYPATAALAAQCTALLYGEEETVVVAAPAVAAESAHDIVADIEAREQARLLAELDAAEVAAMEAMAAYDAQQDEVVEASPVTPMVDLADIVDFDLELPARELEPQQEPAAVPPAPTFEPVSDVRPFPAPPPVMIGDVAISPTLYSLFMDEARGHLAVLQSEIGQGGVPGTELTRAAHTLGSISGTTGIMAIHRLARALELSLGRLAMANVAPADAQRFTFARAVGALEGMLGAVANRRLPGEEAELASALENLHPEFPLPATADQSPPPATEERPQAAAFDTPALALPESLEERRAQRMDDEVDIQLLPLFLEESTDLLRAIGAGLRDWRGTPENTETAKRLQRELHTLKGSARMAGVMGCGELLHSMESRIEQAVAMRVVAPEMLDSLETSYDRVAFLVERLRHGEFAAAADTAPAAEPDVSVESAESVAPDAAATPGAPANIALAQATAAAPLTVSQQTHLRVRADLVDRLVNDAGEVAIARGRIEGEMRALKGSLLELTENVIRLRSQLREIEIQAETQMQAQLSELRALAKQEGAQFDPLEFDRFTRFQELTRMMAESVNDVSTVQHTLLKNLDGANASLTAQARLNRELSQRLMSVRLVPFDTLAERLHRVVRQAAKDCGKRANLDIRSGQTGIDRSVLEKIVAPLEHLLRNAVAHGIELPAERSAAGKDVFGQITVSLAQEGNEVVITLADDGSGLDFARIRACAVASGLLAAETESNEQQLSALIFRSGFSTARELTATSGRGVGMDVVKNEIEALGGRIEISTVHAQGTTFRLYLPLTLAVAQAVIIESGGRRYALPSSMVEQASELKPEAIAKVRQEGGTEWLGRHYPWYYLPHLQGEPQAQPIPARRHWLLLIKGGSERIALEIDGLVGNQEIVIKAIGPQLARVPGVSGATVLVDGEIALIINPIALAVRSRTRPAETALPDAAATPAISATQLQHSQPAPGCVMVVDDSLTVRKITGRLLGRQGYQVVTAKDGVDALEQLDELMPDVMLVDIEMPRMDGFELTRTLRADPRLRGIPVIMITSRSADKHRQYAQELGVDHYLGKPYDEEQLLALVAGYISQKGNSQ